MKKVLAIILSIAMLFGVLAINTFADATPSVTVVTNEGSPVDAGTLTYFTVKFDNFNKIKGMDVTITADGGTQLGEDIIISGFNGILAEKDGNYTFKDNTIHIVDLTGSADGKIVFEATAPAATANIKITGKYAESGEVLFDIDDAEGKFEVAVPVQSEKIEEGVTEEKPYEIKYEEVTASKKFVPYGGVYKEVNGEFVFAEKDENGDFKVIEDGYEVQTFDIPKSGITTFGATKEILPDGAGTTAKSLRFGSYSDKLGEGVTHGTLVFEGDWLSLKEYYIKKGYTVAQILEALYKDYDRVNPEGKFTHVYYNITDKNGNPQVVNVYKRQQEKYMWRDTNAGILEYAVRIRYPEADTFYSAAAYSVKDGKITFAEAIKTVKTDA